MEGRTRLLQDNLHEESRVDTRIMPGGDALQPLSGHRTDPGNNIGAVRELSDRRRAIEASEAGKSASSDDEGEASAPAPPPPSSARRRFMPFYAHAICFPRSRDFIRLQRTVTQFLHRQRLLLVTTAEAAILRENCDSTAVRFHLLTEIFLTWGNCVHNQEFGASDQLSGQILTSKPEPWSHDFFNRLIIM